MSNQDTLLHIIRLGIGHYVGRIADEIDWDDIQVLAEQQELLAIIVDGVEKLPEDKRPPKMVLLQWIGVVLQNYEQRYELYRRTIAEMAAFYNQHGCKMMVLKGYACSMNWPKPEHRPCGDIDMWQFGKQKEADALLAQEKGLEIDKSHHHHTVFCWRDFMVENHYDFVNTKDLQSSKMLEKIFKELGQDDSRFTEIFNEKVYLPSPNLHALFLLRHSLLHFVSTFINLRQLLDWGFFVKAHTAEVDWKWLLSILDEYNMREYFNCINAICVENLGFDSHIFPYVQFDPFIKEKVLNDILNPKYGVAEPKHLVPRLIYKYRRWQGNAWKHDMCYNESRLSAFCTGIWAKLLKPASF